MSRCGTSVCMCCYGRGRWSRMAGSTRFGLRGWRPHLAWHRLQGYCGTLQGTGHPASVRFSFWKLALKQGWLVGLGRWDITKHWIWTDGLASAARVDDAGYRVLSRRRRRALPPRRNAMGRNGRHGGVARAGRAMGRGGRKQQQRQQQQQQQQQRQQAGGMRNAVLPRTTHVDHRGRVSGPSVVEGQEQ